MELGESGENAVPRPMNGAVVRPTSDARHQIRILGTGRGRVNALNKYDFAQWINSHNFSRVAPPTEAIQRERMGSTSGERPGYDSMAALTGVLFLI